MASENGLFQHYFTTYRRAPPRRYFALWGRQKSTRSVPNKPPNILEAQVTAMDLSTPPLVTNGNGTAGGLEPASPSPFDPEIFRSYLSALLPPVVGALPSELDSLFDDREFDERVSQFASEVGGVVYVVKVKEDMEGVSSLL